MRAKGLWAGLIAGGLAFGVALAFATAALAAAPPNDNRAEARPLGTLPATVSGTTVGATLEPTEPPSGCVDSRNSVWYSFTASQAGRIVAELNAAGDLDAVVTVFRSIRSQTQQVDCDTTDAQGNGSVSFRVEKDATYLVRVAQLANSVSGSFTLRVSPPPEPSETAPGAPLAPGGVNRTVDRDLDPLDAYSADLRAGTTYRINLATRSCLSLRVIAPGAVSAGGDFDSVATDRRLFCGGYVLYTPKAGTSGRYSLVVETVGRLRGRQAYHLQVAAARADDTAPGLFIRNYAHARGALEGSRIDVVDLYRFDVTSRSELSLQLSADRSDDFQLVLLDDRGRRIAFGFSNGGEAARQISRSVRRGRYYVAVQSLNRSNGHYVLRRISRTITTTGIGINGRRRTAIAPGSVANIGVRVRPGSVSGPLVVTIERFDPLFGWQFYRSYRLQAVNGRAKVAFRPPRVGRWRASARFNGTRIASPSESSTASLLVAAPLRQ